MSSTLSSFEHLISNSNLLNIFVKAFPGPHSTAFNILFFEKNLTVSLHRTLEKIHLIKRFLISLLKFSAFALTFDTKGILGSLN